MICCERICYTLRSILQYFSIISTILPGKCWRNIPSWQSKCRKWYNSLHIYCFSYILTLHLEVTRSTYEVTSFLIDIDQWKCQKCLNHVCFIDLGHTRQTCLGSRLTRSNLFPSSEWPWLLKGRKTPTNKLTRIMDLYITFIYIVPSNLISCLVLFLCGSMINKTYNLKLVLYDH